MTLMGFDSITLIKFQWTWAGLSVSSHVNLSVFNSFCSHSISPLLSLPTATHFHKILLWKKISWLKWKWLYGVILFFMNFSICLNPATPWAFLEVVRIVRNEFFRFSEKFDFLAVHINFLAVHSLSWSWFIRRRTANLSKFVILYGHLHAHISMWMANQKPNQNDWWINDERCN